jgi:hypothetical protein
MSSIFNPSDLEATIERINHLTPSTPAQWGKMDVAQMMVHASKPFQVATGELNLKRNFIAFLIGGWAKKRYITNGQPFEHNSPTVPNFVIVEPQDFDKSKAELIAKLRQVSVGGHDGLTKDPHPFFGKMNGDEWDRLLSMHTDHHLRQFGV